MLGDCELQGEGEMEEKKGFHFLFFDEKPKGIEKLSRKRVRSEGLMNELFRASPGTCKGEDEW